MMRRCKLGQRAGSSVNEIGDENGERLGSLTRNPSRLLRVGIATEKER